MFINDDLSVSKQAKLLFMSQILFCRLLKQTAKENLRHKEQLSLFAHR